MGVKAVPTEGKGSREWGAPHCAPASPRTPSPGRRPQGAAASPRQPHSRVPGLLVNPARGFPSLRGLVRARGSLVAVPFTLA